MKHPLPKCTHVGCVKTANYALFEDYVMAENTQVCKDHIDPDARSSFKALRSLCEVCNETAPTYGVHGTERPTHCRKCALDYNKVDPVNTLVSFRKRKSQSPEPVAEYLNEEDLNSDEEYERIRPRCPRELEEQIHMEARKIVDVIEGLSKPLSNAVKKLIISENAQVVTSWSKGTERSYDFIIGQSNLKFQKAM